MSQTWGSCIIDSYTNVICVQHQFTSIAVQPIPLMASSLKEIFARVGLQDTFAEKLLDDGWTVPLFAVTASSLDKFEEEIDVILGELAGITTPIQRSALKLAWQECQPQTRSEPSSSRAEPATEPSSPATGSSWIESFAPKLTSATVAELKAVFRKSYPSEILVSDNTPSLRLLSLVYRMKQTHDFKWVPWKYRLTQQKADEITSKTAKTPKMEHTQLHSLILDQPPELNIENGSLGLMAVRQMFEVYSIAMAMAESGCSEAILFEVHESDERSP